MRVYIRNQNGRKLIEKGRILCVGGGNNTYLITGDNEKALMSLAEFKDAERAEEILNEIIQRTVQPTAKEVEKGIIFIDLKGIE